MTIDTIRRVYQEVLHGVPYNSISQFYEFFSEEAPDPRFGASCGFQALEVGRRLRAAGLEGVRFLVDGRHAAAVCELEGRTFLFDPYLMHLDPIDLSALAANDGTGDFPAYPFVEMADGTRRPSLLRVKYASAAGTISLEYMKVERDSGRHVLARYFRLAFASAIDEAPPPEAIRAILHHPEQNNLSVRVVFPEDGSVRDLVYPICYYHGDPAVVASRLVVRTARGEWVEASARHRFEREVERIARAVHVTTRELVDFVLGGVAIYERHAPATIDYAPYSDFRPSALDATTCVAVEGP